MMNILLETCRLLRWRKSIAIRKDDGVSSFMPKEGVFAVSLILYEK